jgi:YidC/Oxa1 family membrane protein insertase
MFSYIWHTFFFDPVYNGLVFFVDVLPKGDVGLAIIALVIVVKTLLLPLSIKAVKTQRIMRELSPKLAALKETHKDNREAQAKAMMELYREAGLNPFAGIAVMFIQIPILIALYFAVYSGGGIALPAINTVLLYGFIPVPEIVNMNFLGLIDITSTSLLLALLAGFTQYLQVKYAMPPLPEIEPGKTPDFKDDLARMMQVQMKYVLPPLIFVVGYTTSAAIALYFVVSNIVAVVQEIYVRKHR